MSCEQMFRDPVLLFWTTDAVDAAHPTILGEAIRPKSPPPFPGPAGRDPPFRAFGVESPNTVVKLDFCKKV